MKKYAIGFTAVCLAVAAAAFTAPKKEVNYYWYKRTAANSYTADGMGADPQVSCSGSGQFCAKGFLSSQVASSIKDNTVADDERVKSN